MPLYEYQCDACGHRFEVIQKFSDRADRRLPEVRRPGAKLLSSPAIQFKGIGLVHHRLRARSPRPTPARPAASRQRLDESEQERVEREVRARATRRQVRHERVDLDSRHRTSTVHEPQPKTEYRGFQLSDDLQVRAIVQVLAERLGRDRAASARSRPPLSGTPACCRCRGGRRRSRTRRSAALRAAAAGRWSAESRRSCRSRSPRARGRCRA